MLQPTFLACFTLLLSTQQRLAYADTPADCRYEDAAGTWLFKVSDFSHSCSEHMKVNSEVKLNLNFPNLAMDQFGNIGFWTLIYNQGFEVTIAHRKWLVMFAYSGDNFDCSKGMPTWTYDILMRQWRCSVAVKLADHPNLPASPSRGSKLSGHQEALRELNEALVNSPGHANLSSPLRFAELLKADQYKNVNYKPDSQLIRKINGLGTSWKAMEYPQHANYTLRQHILRSGAKPGLTPFPSIPGSRQAPPPVSPELAAQLAGLPEEFDWRKPSNHRMSPLTPVRNQESCGSCYAFASAAALEARIQLASNFTHKPVLSPQDVVDCSPYSEGCEGGFPYLIAGKYAEVRGIPVEQCDPYTGKEHDQCPSEKGCDRYYATNYRYVGGYYGATNAELMQLELIHKGPIPIGFNVYPDFKHYKTGVYKHTKLTDIVNKFDPFVVTNHAVLLVGYGIDSESNLPYWAVKNSWGPEWGEDGYFRILRGSNECGVESCALSIDPVL